MTATIAPAAPAISRRDRAVLAAVAAGRAAVRAGALVIDGRFSADQFALARLARAGLLTAGSGAARLTPAGDHALHAA
ncbi:hypothetical protein ACQPX6_11875 [Actinomycetospora sp. CA-101289]|uniref:hypothetical protein n=1 Tax=Actinomycetospora sp. CA-101289 TaxID=3239893 RepID=UPI003D9637F1